MMLKLSLLAALLLPAPTDKEAVWTSWVAQQVGGVKEFQAADGSRVDVLTDTHAIEIDFVEKWEQAPSQAITYARLTNKTPAVILLAGRKNSHMEAADIWRCLYVCKVSGVDVLVLNMKRLDNVSIGFTSEHVSHRCLGNPCLPREKPPRNASPIQGAIPSNVAVGKFPGGGVFRAQHPSSLDVRGTQCFFNSKSDIKTMAYGVVRSTQLLCPGPHGLSFALEGKQSGLAGVRSLLLRQGPYDIVGAVVPVVVEPLKRVFFAWPLTHVASKGTKRISPPVAYSNTPAAVVGMRGFPVAPTNHCQPDFVKRMLSNAFWPGNPNFTSARSGNSFSPVTPAADRTAAPQVASVNCVRYSAVTLADPEKAPLAAGMNSIMGVSPHKQTPKPLARQINRIFSFHNYLHVDSEVHSISRLASGWNH